MPDIYFLEFDERNEEHQARHGVSPTELRQVLENQHLTRPNPKAPERILLMGYTHGGRALVVVLASTDDEATWRPVTAWIAEPQERKVIEGHLR